MVYELKQLMDLLIEIKWTQQLYIQYLLNNNEDLIISEEIKSMAMLINYHSSYQSCIRINFELTIEQSDFMWKGGININNRTIIKGYQMNCNLKIMVETLGYRI
ncbi:unnamed protein product [Paramecium pentaurelia]|uniref:Uncharacterized protein n=1 Tax=Paramecium pentaurelia TaxID=43138 RepID=A0A8S1Y767_9CILI|nr:unnamed protein product [Paramecium pentaurelia]